MSTFLTKHRRPKKFVDGPFFFTGDQAFSGILFGKSRSGKTVQLVGMMDRFVGLKHYNFINDCAKGYSYQTREPRSELLMWFSKDLQFIKGARFIVPPDCSIDIQDEEIKKKYKVYPVSSYKEIFDVIALGGPHINVIAIDSFLLSPMAKARFWALFVIELRANIFPDEEKENPLPMIGALDQINYIFPSTAVPIVRGIQTKSSGWFTFFMNDSAGTGVRMLATSHRIKEVNKSVRDAFLWKFFKCYGGELEDISKKANIMRKTVARLEPSEVFTIDDGDMNDFFDNIPNITYDPVPVYYKGDRILDDLWMLDSEHQILVMTPAEIHKLSIEEKEEGELSKLIHGYEELLDKTDKLELSIESYKIGDLWLSGMKQDDIVIKVNKSKGTVNNRLNWCRDNRPGFREQEKRRVSKSASVIRT